MVNTNSKIMSQKSMVNRPHEMLQQQQVQEEADRNEISDIMKFRKKYGDQKKNYTDRLYLRKSSQAQSPTPSWQDPQSPTAEESPHFGSRRKIIDKSDLNGLEDDANTSSVSVEDEEAAENL